MLWGWVTGILKLILGRKCFHRIKPYMTSSALWYIMVFNLFRSIYNILIRQVKNGNVLTPDKFNAWKTDCWGPVKPDDWPVQNLAANSSVVLLNGGPVLQNLIEVRHLLKRNKTESSVWLGLATDPHARGSVWKRVRKADWRGGPVKQRRKITSLRGSFLILILVHSNSMTPPPPARNNKQ